ncbi:MAG: hypothetical protein JNK15_11915 [Planctomycetes bacterium]|nr:hypothetical protein [Planctomycetota bacterium]
MAAGSFSGLGGVAAANIAWFDGSTWTGLGAGTNGPVYSVLREPNGDLIATGTFNLAGNVPVGGVARWNGQAWSAVGTGAPSIGLCSALLANGHLVVGGLFAPGAATWDGAQWTALGGGVVGEVVALLALPNGELIVGGGLSDAGGVPVQGIARWTGFGWATLGTGMNGPVRSLARMPNGDVVAGGDFTLAGGVPANGIARWNGTAWAALGTGLTVAATGATIPFPTALLPLPNGDLIAVGTFSVAGGTPANRIARWNGSTWSPIGAGLDGQPSAAVMRPQGDVVVGGSFLQAGGFASAHLARLTTTCPAAVGGGGAGCAGSNGVVSFQPQNLPWVGTKFLAQGTGIVNPSLAITVTGLGPTSVPLATLLPPSPPGCLLLVTPDVLDAAYVTQGTLTTQVQLPNNQALAGIVLHQQLVLVETNANLAILQTTVSNALTVTIGAF